MERKTVSNWNYITNLFNLGDRSLYLYDRDEVHSTSKLLSVFSKSSFSPSTYSSFSSSLTWFYFLIQFIKTIHQVILVDEKISAKKSSEKIAKKFCEKK